MDIYVSALLAAEAVFALFLLYKAGLLTSAPRLLLSIVLTAAAFVLRAALFDHETLDYQNFLTVWVDFFRRHGGFRALNTPVGNYNIPYLYFLALFSYSGIRDLYLIKLLSVFFDVVLAYAAMQLVGKCTQSDRKRLFCFFAVLFMPTVVLNGALWGQCDSTYTALAVLGIYLALDDRPVLSMMSIALSFGFKLQAVFVMPVYAVLWMYGKFSWKHFLIFPLSYVLLVLPAVLLGRPFLETLTLYFNQTGSIGSGLNYNSPSVFALIRGAVNEQAASKIAILAAFIYMCVVLFAALLHYDRLSDRSIVAMAVLFAIGIPFLLPHMHDRYFFASDVLTLVMGCCVPLCFPAALLAQFASLLGYHAYLRMRYFLPMSYGACALVISMVIAVFFWRGSLKPKKIEKAY